MMFLQIAPEVAERLFDTNPVTVFGILVFLLTMAVVALWLQSNKRYAQQVASMAAQYERQIEKLVELNVGCVETLKDLGGNLERLRDAGVNMTEDLRREINLTREHIGEKLDHLAQQQRHGNTDDNGPAR